MNESIEQERRFSCIDHQKENVNIGLKLAKIETILEGIKEQISSRFDSVKNWQKVRDVECDKLSEDITKLRIEQGVQEVKVGIFSIVGAAIMSAVVAYFSRK